MRSVRIAYGRSAVAEDFAINVDFAVLRRENGSPRTLLEWATASVSSIEPRPRSRSGSLISRSSRTSIRPVSASGFLKRKFRVDEADLQVALPEDELLVLQVAFVDVQQEDGVLVQTPSGKLITIDGRENQLFARFRSLTGFSVTEYVKQLRMAPARQLLITSDHTVAEIATAVGYPDPFYFSRQFSAVNGVSPREFRARVYQEASLEQRA